MLPNSFEATTTTTTAAAMAEVSADGLTLNV